MERELTMAVCAELADNSFVIGHLGRADKNGMVKRKRALETMNRLAFSIIMYLRGAKIKDIKDMYSGKKNLPRG